MKTKPVTSGRLIKVALLSSLLLPAGVSAQQAGTNPVKVYLMMGQSNMVGHGNWYNSKTDLTLRTDLTDPTKPYPLTQAQVDIYDAPRSDVWVEHQGSNYPMAPGALEPGFAENLNHIGVEMAMGHTLGDAYANQFYFFKWDVGGTSLGFNWRPPSAVAARGGEVGPLYIKALRAFHLMLRDFDGDSHYPDYNGSGYEIAGLVWLQGWNEYGNADFRAEYRENLVDFVHDVRTDLAIPDLPAIIVDCPRNTAAAAHEEIAAAKVAAVADLNAELPGCAVYVDSLGCGDTELGAFYHWNYLAHYHLEMGNRIGAAAPAVMRATPPNHDGDAAIMAAGAQFLDASARIIHYRVNEGSGLPVSNSGISPDADGTLTDASAWTGDGLGPGSGDSIDATVGYSVSTNADPSEIGNLYFTNTCWIKLGTGLPDVDKRYVFLSSGEGDKGFNFGVRRRQVGGQWKNVLFYDLRYREEMGALNDTLGRPDLVLEEDKPYFVAFVRNMGADSAAKDNTMLYLYDPQVGTLMANDGDHHMVQKAWPYDNLLVGVGRDNSNLLDLATRFSGLVDDVQIWDHSLTEDDLLKLATQGNLATAIAGDGLQVTGSGFMPGTTTFFIEFSGAPGTQHQVKRSADLADFSTSVPLLPGGDGMTDGTGAGRAEFDVSGLPAPHFFRVEE